MVNRNPAKERQQEKDACLRALAAKPDDVAALCRLGWSCRGAGEPLAAETAFRRAVAVEPSSQAARYGLAVTCLRRGRIAEGIEHIRVCIEQAPGNHDYWTVLAKLNRNAGRIVEALENLRTALTLAPDDIRTGQRLLFQSLLHSNISPAALRLEQQFKKNFQPLEVAEEALISFLGALVNNVYFK